QDLDLLPAERFGLGRHPLLGVVGLDAADQLTFPGAPGPDCLSTGFASGSSQSAIEAQAALLLFRPVALPAASLQNRPHVSAKVDRLRWCSGYQRGVPAQKPWNN